MIPLRLLHVGAVLAVLASSAAGCSSSDPTPAPGDGGVDAALADGAGGGGATADAGATPVSACTGIPDVPCSSAGVGGRLDGCDLTAESCTDGHLYKASCDGDGNCVCSIDGVDTCSCSTGVKTCDEGGCSCASDESCCFRAQLFGVPGGG